MNIDYIYEKVTNNLEQDKLKKFTVVCMACIAIGIVGFFGSLLTENPERGWMAYLINLVYFMGIAQAGIIFSVIIFLTKAKWGRRFKRISEGFSFFLPIAFLLIIIFIFGSDYLYPWIKHPIHEKEAWLNKSGFFIRNLIALGLLFTLSFVYLYYSIRPDAGFLKYEKKYKTGPLLGLFSKNWKGLEKELFCANNISSRLSPIIAVLYAIVFSFVGIDFIMSLDPHWVSTLFGAYVFMTCIFQALAAIAIVSILIKKPFGIEEVLQPDYFHDLGILLFAFTMVSLDFFYSQYLVIWYANLPEETHYVILRTAQTPWQGVAYSVLAVAFAIPFLTLISKKVKRSNKGFLLIALIISVGMWFERFIQIAPSIWHKSTLPFGWQEISITIGFFGLFGLAYSFFLKNIPVLPVTDPLLYKHKEGH